MRRILCVVFCILPAAFCRGQENGMEAVRMTLERTVEDLAGEGNEDAVEDILLHFEKLLHKPMDINRATAVQLHRLGILTDFQVESLLEYRRNSGRILSATELRLVNGFHREIVEILQPFITFCNRGNTEHIPGGKGYSSTLLLKWWPEQEKEEYIGPPFHSQIKYSGEYAGKFSGGFTLEKDTGEKFMTRGGLPMGDFFSFHIGAQGLPAGRHTTLRSLVLGDYTIRFGQGLAVWNAFTLNGDLPIQGIYRRGEAVAPYRSSDENKFFRGGAVTLERNMERFLDLETTLFFSLKKVDARINGDKYTSLPTDGMHNTESLLQTRKTLGEMVYGARAALKTEKAKLGLNYIGYGYNARNGRRVQEYNRHQMYSGQHGNISIDASAIIGGIRVFAEAAVDYGGNFAVLLGILSRIAGCESALTFRNYSKSYIAPYAGALSTGSSCSNQEGATLTLQKQAGNTKLTAGGTYTYYPHTKYGTQGASSAYKVWLQGGATQGRCSWDVKLKCSGTNEKGREKMDACPRLGAKGTFGILLRHWILLKVRGEFTTRRKGGTGSAAALDMELKLWKENLKLLLRCAYYNCLEWENRLYMYEYDLPSSYSSRLLYGKGLRWYALVQCRIWKNCNLHLKTDNGPGIKLGVKVSFF